MTTMKCGLIAIPRMHTGSVAVIHGSRAALTFHVYLASDHALLELTPSVRVRAEAGAADTGLQYGTIYVELEVRGSRRPGIVSIYHYRAHIADDPVGGGPRG